MNNYDIIMSVIIPLSISLFGMIISVILNLFSNKHSECISPEELNKYLKDLLENAQNIINTYDYDPDLFLTSTYDNKLTDYQDKLYEFNNLNKDLQVWVLPNSKENKGDLWKNG